MASNHVLGCSWGHTCLFWMKFSENVGMIPIKICNFLQFLFTWTNEPRILIQIVWKLCCHPVYLDSKLLMHPNTYTNPIFIFCLLWVNEIICKFLTFSLEFQVFLDPLDNFFFHEVRTILATKYKNFNTSCRELLNPIAYE